MCLPCLLDIILILLEHIVHKSFYLKYYQFSIVFHLVQSCPHKIHQSHPSPAPIEKVVIEETDESSHVPIPQPTSSQPGQAVDIPIALRKGKWYVKSLTSDKILAKHMFINGGSHISPPYKSVLED